MQRAETALGLAMVLLPASYKEALERLEQSKVTAAQVPSEPVQRLDLSQHGEPRTHSHEILSLSCDL